MTRPRTGRQKRLGTHRRSGFLATIIAVGVLGMIGAPMLRSAKYLKPTRRPVSQGDRASVAQRHPGLEDVVFRSRDGITLSGWFDSGPRGSAVIFIHGLGGNRLQLMPEADIVARHGHGFLVYDSRASGMSGGTAATWGDRERLDVAAALDFVAARRDVDPDRIGLYGFSVGSTAAALVAADDPRVRAVVLGPIWPSLSEELDAKFRNWGPWSPWLARKVFKAFGVDVDHVRPVDAVSRIAPRPLFFISGTEDRDTPPGVIRRMYVAAPFASKWLVPGAGHGGFVSAAPEECDVRLGGFFDSALAGARRHASVTAQTPLPADLDRMVETERAFAHRASVVGVRDAFLEYFADDAVRFGERPEPYKPFLLARPSVPPSAVELTWEPRAGDIAASGELGYLTGPATRTVHGGTTQTPANICYFSIWKKNAAGVFRVFIDQGIATPGPAPFGAGFVRADASHRYSGPGGDGLTTLKRSAEALAGGRSRTGAHRTFFHPAVRVYRDGTMPLVAADASRRLDEEFGAGVHDEPLYQEAARSADLGFTYGRYEIAAVAGRNAESGHYVRVWTRDDQGRWQVVLDVHAPKT